MHFWATLTCPQITWSKRYSHKARPRLPSVVPELLTCFSCLRMGKLNADCFFCNNLNNIYIYKLIIHHGTTESTKLCRGLAMAAILLPHHSRSQAKAFALAFAFPLALGTGGSSEDKVWARKQSYRLHLLVEWNQFFGNNAEFYRSQKSMASLTDFRVVWSVATCVSTLENKFWYSFFESSDFWISSSVASCM